MNAKNATLTAALAVGLLGLGVAAADTAKGATLVQVVGHRGVNDGTQPENSRAAIKAGLQAGANGVEVDIRRTVDGQIVVMHDSTLDRTTNCTGVVEEMTYDAVRACDLGNGEKVPNLFEAAWEFSKWDSSTDKIWVHVKLNPTVEMRSKIFKAIDKYDLRAKTVIFADEDDMLDDFAKWSNIERALIFNQSDVDQGAAESWGAGFDYVVPYRTPVTAELVAQGQAAGSKVFGLEDNWVALEDVRDLGLDGFMANRVAAAVQAL